jgi:hyperosmotically inducible periplasmic protein
MRVKQTILNGVLGGALLLGGPAAALATTDSADDRLEDRIEKSLNKVEALGGLDVDVDAGVTTLKGEVASTAEKAKAEKLARSAGAKKVVNEIVIDADKAIARIKERAEEKKERIDERATRAKDDVDRQTQVATDKLEGKIDASKGATGTTTATGDKAPNKEVFDPLVTAKIKTKIIKDDLLDKSEINVNSDNDGAVTLKGTVPSEAAKARALELARTTEGVRKVVDQLTVKAVVVK